ncbi:MAG: portal protein, partial [Reyranella sp.]|nr:portal protein [Reyranella sp.]
LADNILPRRGSFLGPAHHPGRGDKRNAKLLDSTAMLAARTLASGLMSGLSSPARPWFRLGIGSPQLSEIPEVRLWLDDVTQRMLRVFARSNLYNALAVVYEELGVFGTAAMVVVEDVKDVVRAYPLTAGEYWLAQSERLTVNTLYRALSMTTFQLVERFGRGAVSLQVRERYDRGEWDREVEVVHAIEPNEGREVGRLDNRNMPFRSVWFEKSGAGDAVLSVGGFEEFPALCPRWHLIGNDVWGRSPGMDALPDAKSLQLMQMSFAQALEKMINPPMVASPSLRGSTASGLPAAITYVADTQGAGFKPAYQINPPLDQMSAAIERRQQAVRAAFYADLFLMATQLDDVRSATEIAERRDEKL